MKTLFYFQGQEASFEVFADDVQGAHKELERMFGNGYLPVKFKLATQNYSCPKCGCQATECNFS